MIYTQIEIQNFHDGRLQMAVLNQPDSYNSFTADMLRELRHFIHECNTDENVRCAAITGRGKAFSSGQNLKEALKGFGEEERIIQRIVVEYYNPLVKEIVNCSKPVVALVNGAAVGAGAMLALICDFAVAAESAYFSQAFVNIGLIPDTGGTYFLPKLLGRQQANYLAMTGKKLSAQEAKTLGLIAEVFPDADFEAEAKKVLEQLVQLPTKAIALTKKAFNSSYGNSLNAQLDLEGILQQEAAETEDFKEGIAAFLEKRKPNYQGK